MTIVQQTNPEWDVTEWADVPNLIPTWQKDGGPYSFDKNKEHLIPWLKENGYLSPEGAYTAKADSFVDHCLQHYESHYPGRGMCTGYLALSYDTCIYDTPECYDFEKHSGDVEFVNEMVRQDVFNGDFIGDQIKEINGLCTVEDFTGAPRSNTPNWDAGRYSEQILYHSEITAGILKDFFSEEGIDEELDSRTNPDWFEDDEQPEVVDTVKGELFAENFYRLWGLYLFSVQWKQYTDNESLLYQLRWQMGQDHQETAEEYFDFLVHTIEEAKAPGVTRWFWHADVSDLASMSNEHCDLLFQTVPRVRWLVEDAVIKPAAELVRRTIPDTVRIDGLSISRTTDQGRTWETYWDAAKICEQLPGTHFAAYDQVMSAARKGANLLECMENFISACDELGYEEEND